MTARPADGFTLVEMLVALTVLALVGAAVVRVERVAVASAGKAQARAETLTAAASLLAERMAGARGDGDGRLPGGDAFRIASRPRADLARRGAPYVPVEHVVSVSRPGSAVARIGGIGWTERSRR